MKVKVETYKLVCDSCGETFENGYGFTCYTDDPDGSLIWGDASASNWLKVGDKHYCPDCWNIEDDDSITTKDGRRFNEEGEEIV